MVGFCSTLSRMSLNDVISAIDSEIARIEEARDLLTGPGTKTHAKKSASTKSAKRKRTLMSPEARERIADAQRERWAVQNKAET
jgi:hypothetical protein